MNIEIMSFVLSFQIMLDASRISSYDVCEITTIPLADIDWPYLEIIWRSDQTFILACMRPITRYTVINSGRFDFSSGLNGTVSL
jgi:hypothetical protein